MAKSDLRKRWRELKKNYPQFEKDKSFKADLGPNLDSVAKAGEKAILEMKNLHDTFIEMIKSLNACDTILKAYVTAAKAMDNADMLNDIKRFKDDIEEMLVDWEGAQKEFTKTLDSL